MLFLPRTLTFKLTLHCMALLICAMLLIDLVASLFWYQQSLLQRRAQLRSLLDISAASLGEAPIHQAETLASMFFSQQPSLCFYWLDELGAVRINTCGDDHQGLTIARNHSAPASVFGQRLAMTKRFESSANQIATLALVEKEPEISRQFWVMQRYVLVYLLVNAIILTTLAFFRFAQHITKPLQRLIQAANTHHTNEPFAFSPPAHSNEFHHLSYSLNQMLQRIDQDRLLLQARTVELAEKNEQLRANQEKMIRAEKLAATGRLSAGLAHEIGNPLGIIQGYLELLRLPGCTPQEQQGYIDTALKELARVHRLIRHLLDSTRAQISDIRPFDANSLIEEIVTALLGQPLLKGIRLEFEQSPSAAQALANRDGLRQVLLNCILNAVDAIRAAGRKENGLIRIAASLQRDEHPLLLISIEDNGCGMAEETLAHIFDPFFTTKEPGAGTGLGLSVSLSLMTSMQGGIRAESQQGEGARLLLSLPLHSDSIKTHQYLDQALEEAKP